MKTLHTILLLASLSLALVASAAPERARKDDTTKQKPAATETRGSNQAQAKQPAARKGQQATPQALRPTPQAVTPKGNAYTAPGGPQTYRPNQQPVAPAARDQQRPQPDNRSGQHGHDGWDRDRDRDWDRDRDRDRDRDWDRDRDRDRDRDWDRDRNRPGPPHGYVPPQSTCRPAYRPAYRPADWDRPYAGRYHGRWKYAPLVQALLRAFVPSNPRVIGAAIVAHDDTFLGIISRDVNDPESIANAWGRFGNPYSPHSIWNPEGRWGGRETAQSAWNPYATRPPKVYDGNEFRGYLTANPNLYPRIDPAWLRSYLNVPVW